MTLALPADVPILDGWNVWDVLQSLVPVDPAGTLDQQLAAFVREAVGVPDLPIALTSHAAAGEAITSRAVIPELAGVPSLGVKGSAAGRRTIAFESPGGITSIPWPHDGNLILDTVYEPAPAPSPGNVAQGSPASSSTGGASPVRAEQASLLPLVLVAAAVGLFTLTRRRS